MMSNESKCAMEATRRSLGHRSVGRLVGFDGSHAIRLVDAIGSIQEERLDGWRLATKSAFELLRTDLEKIMQGEAPSGRFPSDLLAGLHAAELDESSLGDYVISRTWAGIGSLIQFTDQEVAERAKLDNGVTNAFLAYFSVPFLADGEADFPQVNGVLRQKPIISDGSGNYFCVSIASSPTSRWTCRPTYAKPVPSSTRKS